MNTTELKKIRLQLDKAKPSKLKLVDELISLIKGCFGDKVETNCIRFDSGNCKLGELSVKMIELDPQEFGGVLVHWYPKLDISIRHDPYCSVYMLSLREIKKIIERIKRIHEYYETHNTYLANLK
jgi:hypothetical protein